MRIFVSIWFVFLCAGLWSQILVENPSKDLGDIYENRGKVTSIFTLKNPYKEDTIRIYDIKTSCGCTAILSDDTLIYPQSSTNLKFSYDPKGRSGLFTKSIEVVSRIGIYDQHRLLLKIQGNVVSENAIVKQVDAELKQYLVAPINFYAVTAFDTSYLDFNFFISLVNDLSYEVDFYQFTTIGLEIGVRDNNDIQQLEVLLKYIEAKIKREFKSRGYDPKLVFFDEPVFKKKKLPEWAKASIKVYSVNFGSDLLEESLIEMKDKEVVENNNLMLNYERYSRPEIDEVLNEINFEALEGKLFINGRVDLKGMIMAPARITEKEGQKFAKKLSKKIYKQLKKSSGVSKSDVSISFDSIIHHPKDKFRFQLWDILDEEEQQKFTYVIKPDHITPPKLPTYKQSTLLRTSLDTTSEDFNYFWKNLLLNQKAGYEIRLLIESSKSNIPRNGEKDLLLLARNDGLKIKETLEKMFFKETGRDLKVKVEPFVHGPDYNWFYKKYTDYSHYEYFTVIPLVHQKEEKNEYPANPYMVNFDYFFNGIDTSSWVFSKFARFVAEEVHQYGYVNLIMESSISQVPIDRKKTNLFLAYERALESQKRIKDYMRKQLVDPNRIIFIEERFLKQGPTYDGSIPIIKYRKWQYLKVIPEKHLTQ